MFFLYLICYQIIKYACKKSYIGVFVLVTGLWLLTPEAVAGRERGFIDTPVLEGCLNPANG
jgi:hypothetical protein